MTVSGRRVLITGGGTGLGAELARRFAAAGAEVVIAGRRRELLEATVDSWVRASPRPRAETRAETRAEGAQIGGMRAVTVDVTDESSVASMLEAAGPIDIVIANAGAASSAPLGRTSMELWREMVEVNLTGTFLTFREGLNQMRGRGWGRLIAVASSASIRGYAYVSAYTAAKHGVLGLVRSTALEVARTGITVNALCPGYLDTEMTVRTLDNIVATTGRSRDDALAALVASNPQGRLIAPSEVAAAALWLCSPGSESVNGQAIGIDGGEQ